MLWLLEASVEQRIEAAQAAGMLPSLDEQIKFEARYSAEDDDGSPRILKKAGNVGEISIRGVMTKAPNYMAMLFGGGNTTYSEIISAIAVAEQDDSVKELVYAVESPGGQFDGLFEVLAAMKAAKKPSRAVVSNASSAAYAIVAQAGKIEAVNRASMFGSIGVVAEFKVDENKVEITSTEAPKKRPDVQTEAGVGVIREMLDPMHQLFAESIAEGRGTTVKIVNASFGQGATLLADEALELNMIDSIAGATLSVVSPNKPSVAASADTIREVQTMDLRELKASHPATYAAAVAEGTGQGVAEERERVQAHLTMGAASGDMTTAVSAIKEGSAMTPSLQASYMAAGMNRRAVDTRSEEEIAAAAALDNVDADSDESKDLKASASLLIAVFEACGVDEVEA